MNRASRRCRLAPPRGLLTACLRPLFASLALQTASVALAAALAEPTHAPAGIPRLEIAAPTHDFGSVPQGQRVRHDFTLTNTGTAPLAIIDVKPACGCTTADTWTRSIPPGGTGTIPLQLETAQFVGPISKTIAVFTNDPAHPKQELALKVDVWTPVQISNPVLIFPALTDPSQVVSRSVTIRHKVAGPLKLSDLRSDLPTFAPVLKETVAGQEYELTVTTVPPLPNGTQTARITMKSSNPQMPELSVQAVYTLLPPVQVAPTEIMLPMARLAAPEKRYVVLLNHRGGDLQISDLKTNAEGVELTTGATPDRKQLTILLTFPVGFQADAPGQRFVRGKTNHPDLPTFEVPIVYSGNR